MRRSSRRLLDVLIVLALVTVWGGALVTYGSKVESALWPPVERQIVGYTRTDTQLTFFIDGMKKRDCPVESVTAQWVTAGGVDRVPIMRSDGTPVPTTGGGGNYRAGEAFFLGPYTARITMNALADPGAVFRIRNVYRCSFLWPIVEETTLPLGAVLATTL